MDDVIVLAPTRHKLRRAVKVVNETFDTLGLEKHPDKTFIGRVERGFDFLGYHLAPGRLTQSVATVGRFVERAARLYEQDRREPCDSPRLDAYVRRFSGWAQGGIGRPGAA
jgi:RNA-directed DNA polymerase